jgi:hypothetical protein
MAADCREADAAAEARVRHVTSAAATVDRIR